MKFRLFKNRADIKPVIEIEPPMIHNSARSVEYEGDIFIADERTFIAGFQASIIDFFLSDLHWKIHVDRKSVVED